MKKQIVFNSVNELLENLKEIYGIPNYDCSIYCEHEEIFRKRGGYMDAESKTPVSDSDLYYLYSASKIALATAVMQLVEKNKINLSDSLTKYYPDLQELEVRGENGRVDRCQDAPTIEQLLAMQGGLNYDIERNDIVDLVKNSPEATTQEIVKQFLTEPLDFKPGSRFQYSMCHDVLAAIIEIVSGEKYSSYIQKHIAEPLGMKEVYFHPIPEIASRMVQQYEYDLNSMHNIFKKPMYPIHNRNKYILTDHYDSGGAGIITRLSDYVLLADALANGGVGKSGNRILQPESIENMKQSRLDTEIKKQDYRKNTDYGYEYGLGVRTLVHACTSKGPVGEFGWDGYGGVFVLSDTDNKLSMCLFLSVTDMLPEKIIHHKLRDAMYDDFFA